MHLRTSLVLLLIASPVAALAASDEFKFNLLFAENWHVYPQTLVKSCEREDPAGVQARAATHAAWAERNRQLIETIRNRFTQLAPSVFPPGPGIDVAEAVRAQLTVRALRQSFLGRSAEQKLAVCNSLSAPSHELWSEESAAKARASLKYVEEHPDELAKPSSPALR